jgi:membrane protein YqaA with SNARE-associated domain
VALVALFLLILALNTVPTGIPGSVVVAAFALRDDVGTTAAIGVAVLGATIGRALFAVLVRAGVGWLPTGATRANVEVLERWMRRRRHAVASLAALLLVPGMASTPIFMAAGALRLALAPLLAAFAVGRAAFYGLVVVASQAGEATVSRAIERGVSPWAIAVALLAVLGPLAVLLRLDWRALIEDRRFRLLRRRARG